MVDVRLTLVGNLAGAPELRFTQSGRPVASFSLAQNRRKRKPGTDEWVDDDTLWMKCSAWGALAENAAQCLAKGTEVVVHGRLVPVEWDDKETGAKRRSVELVVESLGASVARATVQVQKVTREGGQGEPEPAPEDGAPASSLRRGRRVTSPEPAGSWAS